MKVTAVFYNRIIETCFRDEDACNCARAGSGISSSNAIKHKAGIESEDNEPLVVTRATFTDATFIEFAARTPNTSLMAPGRSSLRNVRTCLPSVDNLNANKSRYSSIYI